jgi:hypothetical protein
LDFVYMLSIDLLSQSSHEDIIISSIIVRNKSSLSIIS